MLRVLLSTLAVAWLTGCADRPEIPRTPSAGPSFGAPRVAWDDKTEHEKMAYMGAHVEPRMSRLFLEHDADYFSDFDCPTCHGRDMELVDFQMPNDLYPLSADSPVADAMDYDADIAAFMMGEVVPTMAELLAQEPGSAQGVNCFTCHPKD